MASRTLRIVTLLLRLVLGGIFLYAAYTKLTLPWQVFAMQIDSHKLLPDWGTELVARGLPWLEVLVGVMLIVGWRLKVSILVTTALLVGFNALVIRAYAKGMEIDCGCFGPGGVISWKTLLRDASMLAAAVFVTVMAFRRPRKAY